MPEIWALWTSSACWMSCGTEYELISALHFARDYFRVS